MSKARIGHGALFERETDVPGTYESVGEVFEITPPNMTRDAVDATHMQTENFYREFIPGLKDGGEVSFTAALLPDGAVQQRLKEDFDAPTVRNYRIKLPDQDQQPQEYVTFAGIVTGYNPTAPLEDKMTLAFTVKVSGKPVWAWESV